MTVDEFIARYRIRVVVDGANRSARNPLREGISHWHVEIGRAGTSRQFAGDVAFDSNPRGAPPTGTQVLSALISEVRSVTGAADAAAFIVAVGAVDDDLSRERWTAANWLADELFELLGRLFVVAMDPVRVVIL
jgi:hypothetical protein